MEPAEIREPGLVRRLVIDLGPLRRYPAFRRLFIGQTISTFGSEVAAVAAPFQLYQLTHSTLQVGLLSLCELFPLLTLTIVGGAIADAVDRRRMLLVTEVLLALVALGFAFNASSAVMVANDVRSLRRDRRRTTVMAMNRNQRHAVSSRYVTEAQEDCWATPATVTKPRVP